MKYLVISDTHLTSTLNKQKMSLLIRIISDADRVIINGDFWEGKVITFEQFINSSWSELFSLLKEKHAVYLYGNHDPKHKSDDRVNRFSVIQGDRYEFSSGDKDFLLQHGHQYVPLESPFPFFSERTSIKISGFIHDAVLGIFPTSIMNKVFGRLNRSMIKKTRKIVKTNQYFVCGHTHVPELNHDERFLNSGFIQSGYACYLTIDEGTVLLHIDTYNT